MWICCMTDQQRSSHASMRPISPVNSVIKLICTSSSHVFLLLYDLLDTFVCVQFEPGAVSDDYALSSRITGSCGNDLACVIASSLKISLS